MKKLLLLLAILFPVSAAAQTAAFNGYCTLGSTPAMTSGLPSSNLNQGLIPQCTVTVFLTGTTNLASIYADLAGTPLTNPFTASTKAQWLFFAATQQGYDVVMSGGFQPLVYTVPVTLTDLIVGAGGGAGCTTSGVAGTLVASNGTGGCQPAQVEVNGVPLITPSPVNIIDSSTVTVSNPGTGQIQLVSTAGLASFTSGSFNPFFTTNLGSDPTRNPALAFSPISNATFTFPGNFTGGSAPWSVWTLAAGTGISLTPSGSTLTLGATNCFTSGTVNQLQGANGSGGCSPADEQVNGINLQLRNAGNFINGVGTTVVNPSANQIRIDVAPTPVPIIMAPVAPVPGQYVVLYPQTRSGVSGTGGFCQDLGNWGMQLNGASGLVVGANCNQTMSGPWKTSGGQTLADLGISTGSVTSVYTFAYASYYPGYFDNGDGPVASSRTLSCDGDSVLPGTLEFGIQQTTDLTGLSGSGIAGATCTQNMARNSSIQTTSSTAEMTIPSMGLIVYYTGSPASLGSTINVAPPLTYDTLSMTLGLSPLFPNVLYPSVVSLLPSALENVGAEVNVSDSTSPFSCTTGGGTSVVGCIATITGWVPKSSITPSLYAKNLEGGFLGSIPYQTAPNITAFVASPTTLGHTYAMGWVPAAQPQVVQANSCNSTSCTFGSPVTSGDLVFVATVDRFGPPFGCTISDTFGTTYTNVQTALGATGFTGVLASSGTDVISAGGPDATRCGLLIVEISGANATPVDVAGSVAGTTGASFTPNVTTTGTNDLIVLWQGTTGNTSVTITQSLSATFLAGTGLSGGALQNIWSLPAPTATTYTSTITQSPTGNVNLGAMIAFKSGSGGAIAPQAIDLTSTVAGVAQLNGLTGSLSLTSTGGSVTITPSGSTIDLAAVGNVSGITGTSPIVVSPTTGSVVVSCPSCSVGSGTSVTINGGGALGTANFNGTTPAAGSNGKNITFQIASSNISAELVGDGNAGHYLDGTGNYSIPAGTGISGATATQVLIAGSATTATSSKALAGSGAGVTTGPTTTTTNECVKFADTFGSLTGAGTPCGAGGGGTYTSEVVSCSGTTCTLAHTPTTFLNLFRNGLVQVGVGGSPDYTISGVTITLTLTSGTDNFYANYYR